MVVQLATLLVLAEAVLGVFRAPQATPEKLSAGRSQRGLGLDLQSETRLP